MSVTTAEPVSVPFEPGARPAPATPEMTPRGLALSAVLHGGIVALVLFGLPSLFRRPPPPETPIAVQLVTIAPETRATQPNPFKPKPEAKPEPPVAAPAPKPEPKPEPPPPAAEPPSAAAPPPPPPPLPSRKRACRRRRHRRPQAGRGAGADTAASAARAQAETAAAGAGRATSEIRPGGFRQADEDA